MPTSPPSPPSKVSREEGRGRGREEGRGALLAAHTFKATQVSPASQSVTALEVGILPNGEGLGGRGSLQPHNRAPGHGGVGVAGRTRRAFLRSSAQYHCPGSRWPHVVRALEM